MISIRGKLEEAVRIYESIIWRYDEQNWGCIENSLLEKCADAQKKLGKTDQYIESLLTLLKNEDCLEADKATQYTEELLSNVLTLDKGMSVMLLHSLMRKQTHLFDVELRRPFSPMFSVNVVSIIDDPKLVENTSVEICIDNNLPKVGFGSPSIESLYI